MQTLLGKANDETEESDMHISSAETSMKDIEPIFMEPTYKSVKPKRKGFAGCEECDIPFVTKKELKVNSD